MLIHKTRHLRIFLLIFCIAQPYFSEAQKRCSTMEAEKLRVKDQRYLPGNEFFERWVEKMHEAERNKLVPFGTHDTSDPDLIPIVVHVIHNGEPYGEGTNITNEQIYSQIEVLNEDFKRMNADTIDTQSEFLPLASKLNIEFVLARRDEKGQPTTGIIRKQGDKNRYDITVADRELLSSYSHWNPNTYVNIWVTNLLGQYLGLAQFPNYGESQAPDGLPGLDDKPNKDNEVIDGMVIDYEVFGSEDKVPGLELKNKYNLGRTATHEMGHFFGLVHTWGDGGCTADDYVGDTPNSDNDYAGFCVPSDHVSCGTNDMFENYMYYTDDACMNIFSTGQTGRMEVILMNAPRRATLLNSIGTEVPDGLNFDLAINGILAPGKALCEGSIIPVIEVKNNGGRAVTDFGVAVTINGDEFNYTYSGDTIKNGEIVELTFENYIVDQGVGDLSFELTDIPADVDPSNNEASHAFVVDNQKDFIPLRQQFSVDALDDTNWISINEDKDIGWELTNIPYESSSKTAYINLYNYEERKQIDWLISPVLDFADAREASMTFKSSYARNTDFNDQLQVVIAEDCDGYFNKILETYNSTNLSVKASEEFWEPESSSDWKEHSLDLNTYAGQKDLRIAFKVINDYGNNLYLDDIEFYTTAEDKRVSSAQNSYTLYPNPATDGQFQLAFNTSERQEVLVYIYDQLGKEILVEVYPNTLNQTYYFDLKGQSSGIYYIHARGKDFIRSKKLLLTY
jgi:hypothetical protein